MPTRTEAIKLFLQAKTHADLANLYSFDIEVQVNVAQDQGEPIEGEYQGRRWRGYEDGPQRWKAIRIPWNANTKPEFKDSEMSFDLPAHAEGIGMTGWDWKNLLSRWVAYDFDSIATHNDGLTHDQLNEIVKKVTDIEWVEIRKSTSGSGYHLYVHLEPVTTKNHSEHSALARAILGKLSSLTEFDFQARVDTCGGNMWVWHRKMSDSNEGLKLIKAGRKLAISEIPHNWQEHLKVIKRKRDRRIDQSKLSDTDSIEYLANQKANEPRNEDHIKLCKYLEDVDALWWWDQDLKMLVTHTEWLKKAHEELSLKGVFETKSSGTNLGEQNCFAFPLRDGSWVVRRYSKGIQEASSWDQDGQGWTRCYLNREPDLRIASLSQEGLVDKKGNYIFRDAEQAEAAAKMLGVFLEVPASVRGREVKISKHPKEDNTLCVEIKREAGDLPLTGWTHEKTVWYRQFYAKTTIFSQEPEVTDFDASMRHIVTESGEDGGWTLYSDGDWRNEPMTHVTKALQSIGYGQQDVNKIMGSAIRRPWIRVNKPLQPEYPGNREWNRNAAQLTYAPSEDLDKLNYPTWQKLISHCGKGLDDAIKEDPWTRANGLQTGGDYLKCWIAALLQYPTDPLPYLFFYGEQDVGKSVFHEALSEILTRGVKRADAALISQSNFNAELEDAIVCVVEEIDLEHNKTAYNRIKDWVTSRHILIHRKGQTPYQIRNTTHWIQCSNSSTACPIFPGDTRITMCWVESLDPLEKIPKNEFISLLQREAPDFLASVLSLELPNSRDRLKLPVLTTGDKLTAGERNMNPVQAFLKDVCFTVPGKTIKFKELFGRFLEYIDPQEASNWGPKRFSQGLPSQFPTGKQRGTSDVDVYIGNIAYAPPADGEPTLIHLIRSTLGSNNYLVEKK